MLKYGKIKKFNPLTLDKMNIDRQSVDLVPSASSVLDVGCATGFMGEYLIRERKCHVVGVEIGEDEAREAKKVLSDVIVGDVEDRETLKKLKNKFDVIIASAVIEHLKDPWAFLMEARKHLNKDGFIIVTTSNINHWSTRLSLVKGEFEYKDYGILDNTHLRFFNTKTFPKLVIKSGYKMEKFSIDPVGGGFPKISLFFSKFFPNLFAYQMLIKAVPTK